VFRVRLFWTLETLQGHCNAKVRNQIPSCASGDLRFFVTVQKAAADVNRRHDAPGTRSAPTDVGGYALVDQSMRLRKQLLFSSLKTSTDGVCWSHEIVSAIPFSWASY